MQIMRPSNDIPVCLVLANPFFVVGTANMVAVILRLELTPPAWLSLPLVITPLFATVLPLLEQKWRQVFIPATLVLLQVGRLLPS